jgi:ankyrin repeat protein
MTSNQDEELKRLRNQLIEKDQQIQELTSQLRQVSLGQQQTDNDDEAPTLKQNIQQYLQQFPRQEGKLFRCELYLSIVNTLCALFHIDYDDDIANEDFQLKELIAVEGSSSSRSPKNKISQKLQFHAYKIAFNYSLEFFRQLDLKNLRVSVNSNNNKSEKNRHFTDSSSLSQQTSESESLNHSNMGFPLLWLLGMFPYNHKSYLALEDTVWLPVHIFLALESLPAGITMEQYLEDLQLLLMEFGEKASQEEVSLLSIAVAKSSPFLEVIEKILEFNNKADLVEDEDSSIPIMHACACNEDTEVINFLYERNPSSIEKVDNFGASSIHYASYSGYMNTVKYLLEKQPLCVQFVEGNGATPLMDGVQNNRGRYHQIEITQMLLHSFPEAVYKRDNSGALPFHRAVKCSNYQVAELLISSFPKVRSFV